MYNVNGMAATLIQNNRDGYDLYDDQEHQEVEIKVCPYNVDQAIKYGLYTIPEATGYFIVKPDVDILEGDQIVFNGVTYSVLKIQDNWLWNKKANIGIAVK